VHFCTALWYIFGLRLTRTIFTGDQICVWSGALIHQNDMDIDHILPYSVWFNNDLWNLLPTERNLNQKKKKDKISTRELITKRADTIVDYWHHSQLIKNILNLTKKLELTFYINLCSKV